MSDLTRRVLAIVQTDPVVTVCTVPDNDVATLARQVEALEALADELDEAANIEVRTISGEVLDAEYSEGLRYAATRICDALTEADKEADQ